MERERGFNIVPSYSTSAPLYEIMVGRYAFEHWRENFERLEKRYDLDISLVADAGCGTGLAAEYLAGRGAEVYAYDLSPQMLREAAGEHGGQGIRYLKQDMRYLQTPARVSLLISVTDAMNHLLNEEDIRRTLSSFYSSMQPGGYALFDMNTTWQLREGNDDQAWEFEVDGRHMRWLSAWDEGSMIFTLSMAFRDEKGQARDLLEVHRERAYDAGWVLGELARAGFCSAEALDAAGLGRPAERTRRLQFVACR